MGCPGGVQTMRVDVGSVWMEWENTVQRKLRHQAGHQADPPLISLSPLNCQLTQGASPEALEDSEAWLPEPLPCLAPGTSDTSESPLHIAARVRPGLPKTWPCEPLDVPIFLIGMVLQLWGTDRGERLLPSPRSPPEKNCPDAVFKSRGWRGCPQTPLFPTDGRRASGKHLSCFNSVFVSGLLKSP